jgi:hypothetical protein
VVVEGGTTVPGRGVTVVAEGAELRGEDGGVREVVAPPAWVEPV